MFLNSRKYGQSRRAARWFAPSIVVALLLLAPSLHAQFKGQRGAIRAGNGLFETRDSVLTFSLDTTRFGGSAAKDTITLSAVVYGAATCGNQYLGDCDTSNARVFNGADGSHWMHPYDIAAGAYVYPQFLAAHATGDWRVAKIAVTNFFPDPTVGPTWRDTLYVDTTTLVIPRGASVYVAYTGKLTYSLSASYHGLRSTTGCQQVRVYYAPYTGTTPTATGHILQPASTAVQVPLMLGYAAPKGLTLDGFLSVTITMVQR